MINLKHYLSTDHNRVVRLNDYFEYYSALANFELSKGNYDNAEKYMRYATNFISELKKLHDQKVTCDEASELLKQIKQRELSDLGEMIRRNYF
ncbi:hypothetical protein KQI76_06885 [Amphibacillus sp. MSJ-3]|uniref:hypothetical protein n=1 Tax=Amphibacillus sp. MSJ-3 TaxID=2841505 RepID=UPI001C0F1CB7|nr:hypothetical protein [Amphibacillus sp. MSJ-3]MBU5594886.1 hypothetical protein [Amphibacillus sp. MSJ-3]